MKPNYSMVALVFLIFFVISLLTNILGPLIPDIIRTFDLSLGTGRLPALRLLRRLRRHVHPVGDAASSATARSAVMVGRLRAGLRRVAAFALVPRFAVALPSLFLIGIGMTMLQVAINPLLRVAGGEKHFAFFSVAAQLVFGLASFLSPLVYSYLVHAPRRAAPSPACRASCLGVALLGVHRR